MTTKQKLEAKRDVLAEEYDNKNGSDFEYYCSTSFKAGFDSIAPLLFEMVAELEHIKLSGYSDHVKLRVIANKALDKFNKFLEEK